MKDIDFDELDKAVSSLMNQNKQTDVPEPAKPDDDVNVLTLPDYSGDKKPAPISGAMTTNRTDRVDSFTDSPDTARSETKSEPQKPTAPPSASTANTSIVSRTGKFMDVKPPKRVSDSMTLRPSRPNRQAATLQPVNSDVKAEPTSVSDASLADATPTNLTGNSFELVSTNATQLSNESSAWPDPIDMHGMNEDSEDAQSASNQTTQTTNDSDSVSSSQLDTASPISSPAPAETTPVSDTPFLPGAKVEKRPLGGMAKTTTFESKSDDNPAQTDDLSSDTTKTDASESSPTRQFESTKPFDVPAELHHEILSVEGNEVSPSHDSAQTPEAKARPTNPKPTETTSPKKLDSIPQQYKEKSQSNDTHDDEHAHIFDTASYQPLSHPAKKKSGWLIVVVIILLLVIGAGAAAALYYLDLI